MGDFGDNLRQERAARGVALEEISSATKISVRLLQAIENEEFDRLPGGVFNVNFVRQYARHLGLDEEKIVGEFRRLTTPPPEQEGAPKPPNAYAEWGEASSSEYDWDRQRQSQVWMLAMFVVLAIGVAAGVYLLVSSHRNAAPAVSSAAPAPPSIPGGAPAAPSASAASGAPETPAQPPGGEAATKPAGEAAAGATRAATETTAAARAETPAVGVAGVEAPVRVEIRTNGRVWISAVADGQILFQRTLQPDETRVVTAQSAVRLRVGDAAALSVALNGQPQPPIGPKGQVRTVVLTARGMRILAPPPEEPETGAAGTAGGEGPRGQADITKTEENAAQSGAATKTKPPQARTPAPQNP